MSVELIGWIVKGPATLDESRFEYAKRRALARVALAQRIQNDQQDPPDELADWDGSDWDNLARVSEADIESVIESLLDLWVNGMDDAVSRLDPDDPKYLIVFAGDQSYGGEPDGVGYQTIQSALRLDIAGAYDIH